MMVAIQREGPSLLRLSSDDDASSPAILDPVDRILRRTQYLYCLVLLVTFLVLAAWYSVYNAQKSNSKESTAVKGPGGRALPQTKKKGTDNEQRRIGPHFGRTGKNVFRTLAALVTITYIWTGSAMLRHAFDYDDPYRWSKEGLAWAGEWSVIHVVGATFFHLYILVSLYDWRKGPNVVHLSVWTLSLCGELVIFTTTYVAALRCHFVPGLLLDSTDEWDRGCVDYWTRLDLILYFVRMMLFVGLVFVFLAAWIHKATFLSDGRVESGVASESTPLLNGQLNGYDAQDDFANGNGHLKGTARNSAWNGSAKSKTRHSTTGSPGDNSTNSDARGRRRRSRAASNANKGAGCGIPSEPDDFAAFYRPKKLPHKSWWEYLKGYSLFFPYLWPKEKRRLQIHVLACFVLVVVQRVVNMLVPWQVGYVADRLVKAINEVKEGNPLTLETFPLHQLLLLGLLWTLQGQYGLLGSLRALLWIPVSQHSYRSLTTAAFNHVHSLSLEFHLSKRTGEVLSALNKGSAINNFLEQVTFQVVPMLFDLFLSISVFYIQFGPLYAEINMIDTCWYLYMTIKMASTRADHRRAMTNADREEEAVKNDSISSYEVVKYFNAEDFENERYRNKVGVFQHAEAKVQSGMAIMNVAQAIVFNMGRVIAAIVCGWQVAMGTRTAGEWFTIVSYLTQLQGPLNFFGSFYRTVQQAMISGERLLELFKIQPTVVDKPHAKDLRDFTGHIRWKDVSFSYQGRKPALKNISFECLPGTTTAFVGESGGGKSTLFRHIFRYYDFDEGTIELDGKDVRDLTIDSVRRYLGVVPQDTTLFNETILYNLRYANPEASLKEVHDACKAASIHERIMSFPEQYETQVGERGMRLSGGEKQRVAIARTILKNPKVIMLDEATSALDTHTEQKIQDNVWNLGQGRTLLIIAHRLSTITHADRIHVLNGGAIVESGTHEELLEMKGRYASMWEKQVRAEKMADAAREAQMKAARALRLAKMGGGEPGSSGESHHEGSNRGTSSPASGNSSDAEPGHI